MEGMTRRVAPPWGPCRRRTGVAAYATRGMWNGDPAPAFEPAGPARVALQQRHLPNVGATASRKRTRAWIAHSLLLDFGMGKADPRSPEWPPDIGTGTSPGGAPVWNCQLLLKSVGLIRLAGECRRGGAAAQRCSGFGKSKRQPASHSERWLPCAGMPPASLSIRARCSRFQVMNVVLRLVKSFSGPPEPGSR